MGVYEKEAFSHSNSYGVVIEKPILELLNIDRDTELEMTTDGERLIIEPIRTSKKSLRALCVRQGETDMKS